MKNAVSGVGVTRVDSIQIRTAPAAPPMTAIAATIAAM